MYLPLFGFTTAVSAALLTSVKAVSQQQNDAIPAPYGLLSKARKLDDNNGNGGNNEIDFSWVADYSIRFDSCHTTLEFRADGDDEQEDGSPTESLRLVHFKLCPSTQQCSSCKNGADYLVEMREFVESYLEFSMTQQEYNCEQVKENCYCDDDTVDEETCEQQCYTNAGLNYCQDNEANGDDGEDFEIDRYLDCERINEDNGYSNALYVGAYCSRNGKEIRLGTFTDRQCTQKTSNANAFQSYTGSPLPYSSESIVRNDCISCKEPPEYDDDYNADQYDADEVVEICEELYERSAKCEKNLKDVEYTSTGGCDYIFNTLPKAERLTKGGRPAVSVVFAWLFASTTLALAAYAYLLYTRVKRSNIDLSIQGIGGRAV